MPPASPQPAPRMQRRASSTVCDSERAQSSLAVRSVRALQVSLSSRQESTQETPTVTMKENNTAHSTRIHPYVGQQSHVHLQTNVSSLLFFFFFFLKTQVLCLESWLPWPGTFLSLFQGSFSQTAKQRCGKTGQGEIYWIFPSPQRAQLLALIFQKGSCI